LKYYCQLLNTKGLFPLRLRCAAIVREQRSEAQRNAAVMEMPLKTYKVGPYGVVMRLMCGRIFNDHFIASGLLSVSVTKS